MHIIFFYLYNYYSIIYNNVIYHSDPVRSQLKNSNNPKMDILPQTVFVFSSVIMFSQTANSSLP